MNLVSFSIRTKGLRNFLRRLWTVFTRFGFSEQRTQRAFASILATLRQRHAAPTFFIPAVVLARHPKLIADIAGQGAELGIHGYVHNDYRYLSQEQQRQQTSQAMAVFQHAHIPYDGFRNPYLGWNAATPLVLAEQGLVYVSNDAVLHDVIAPDQLPPQVRGGYLKSLALFQAIPCTAYTLRPAFDPQTNGKLLSIPTSIPDDEMLFDRLRITDPKEVGGLWSRVMQRVYDLGGIYVLNLHPERGILCQPALDRLLTTAQSLPLPVWITRLNEVAAWWKERSQFRLAFTASAPGRWQVEATCSPRASLLARHLEVLDQPTTPWANDAIRITPTLPESAAAALAAPAAPVRFTVASTVCPCLAISPETPQDVLDFLLEAGYPVVRCLPTEAAGYAWYRESAEGLGNTREERIEHCSRLLEQIEHLDAPLVHFGCWPAGQRAALSITGDIDSITIQDFFLRILEVRQQGAPKKQ
ncbi:MAG TPA: polysaccharide deacetylase family protein [Ktedonobacterales bacterium]|jgi:peptidoglycan/xylan/chitin deacetylase (PgdA/CDA1 family)